MGGDGGRGGRGKGAGRGAAGSVLGLAEQGAAVRALSARRRRLLGNALLWAGCQSARAPAARLCLSQNRGAFQQAQKQREVLEDC